MKQLFLLLLLLISFHAHAQEKNPLLGFWQTQDKDAVIEFRRCTDDKTTFCGRFYWLEDDSAAHPSLDDKNKDQSLRRRPLCGLVFLGGFASEGEGQYVGGWLYSPRHGATYSASLHLKDHDTLELRGFVFLPFLGGTQEWRRLDKAPACWALRE